MTLEFAIRVPGKKEYFRSPNLKRQ